MHRSAGFVVPVVFASFGLLAAAMPTTAVAEERADRGRALDSFAGFAFAESAGPLTIVRGGYGGRFVTDWLLVGGGGLAASELAPLARPSKGQIQRVSIGCGGFFGELAPFRSFAIRPALGVFVGTGNVEYRTEMAPPYPSEKVSVFAPQASIEADASRALTVGVGGSYRFIEGAPLAKALSRDVAGADAFAYVRIRAPH
jgi:hypothetical protein